MDSDETRECPQCGAVAESWRWDEFEAGLRFPNCPNGYRSITEEGLLSTYILNSDGLQTWAEVGKQGVVISQGRNPAERITSLLESILRLEGPQAGETGVAAAMAAVSAREWRFVRYLILGERFEPEA
jgi:hypothetical protein